MFRLVSLFFSFLLSLSLSLSRSTWGRVGKIPLSVNGDKYYKLGCSPRLQVLAISRSFFSPGQPLIPLSQPPSTKRIAERIYPRLPASPPAFAFFLNLPR